MCTCFQRDSEEEQQALCSMKGGLLQSMLSQAYFDLHRWQLGTWLLLKAGCMSAVSGSFACMIICTYVAAEHLA